MADEKLLIKVAYYYYQKEMTQQQIAEKLSMSRQRVNRLLKKSRVQGVVEIRIKGERESFVRLENRLEERFGLRQAVVLPTPDQERLEPVLGEAAAAYLQGILRDNLTIGLSWGRTVAAAAESLPRQEGLKGLEVVQMVGNMGTADRASQPDEITRLLADKLGARPRLLYAPLLVGSEEAREAFLREESIRTVLDALGGCDIAFLSVSDAQRAFSYFESAPADSSLMDELRRMDPVGNLCLRFYDHHGTVLPVSLHRRIIGVEMETLRSIPNVVCVAGELKRAALWGALEGGFINTLITDASTALFLADY